ncbi:Os01g0392400, partial [Oryza sativa Japonica Group]
ITTPEPSKPRGRAPAFLFHLDHAAGRGDDGRRHRHCTPRERRARRRCSGARTGRRRRVLVVVPTEPSHPKPNSCATRIASTSSSKALKNPSQCRNDEGDRRLLPQVRPPTTVVDSLIPGELRRNSSLV